MAAPSAEAATAGAKKRGPVSRLAAGAPVVRIAGWGASLAIHALLVVGFVGLTWLVPESGQGDRRVRIEVAESPQFFDASVPRAIELPSPALTAPAPSIPMPRHEAVRAVRLTGEIVDTRLPTTLPLFDVGEGGAVPHDFATLTDAGGGAGGGPTASFFGLAAKGRDFVFVVDRSGSMRGEKLQAAKDELTRSIAGLDHGMRFYVIFYDTGSTPMPGQRLYPATESSKRACYNWVAQVNGGGGTDPTAAMKLALSLEPDAVWLLSDGLFPDRCADAIRAANPRRKAQVHTIAFYENSGERVLMRIAEENRGRYRFVQPRAVGLQP